MPLNLLDFAVRGPQQDQPDFLQKFMQGYNLRLAPQQAEAETRRAQLENALLESQAKYAEPMAQANIANLQRQAQFGGFTGPAQEALSLEMLKRKHGENSPVYQNALKSYQLNQMNSQANYDDKQRRINLSAYLAMSEPERKRLQAAWNAQTGRPASELTERILGGENIGNIFQSAGTPTEDIGKKLRYPAEPTNIKDAIENEANYAAYEIINKAKSELLPEWAANIGGYSIQELKNTFDNSNKSSKAELLAGRMLSSSAALSQALAEGGGNSHAATSVLLDTGLSNLRTFGFNITPEDYRAAYQIVNKVMEKAVKERTSILRGEKSAFNNTYGLEPYTQQDLKDTAEKYRMTVEELLIELEED